MCLKDCVISRKELKEFLGIGETTLCKWVNEGVIPSPTRVGRTTVWFRDSLPKIVERMKKRSERTLA